MKVYLLMYHNNYNTEHCGIFSTKEKAEEVADKLAEESKYSFTALDGTKQFSFSWPRHYFSVEEVEVQ